MKIGLFIPCMVDQFYPETGIALVKLLKKAGADFEYPYEQTCCGQPAYNTGYQDDCLPIAKRFIDLFIKYDYIVAPSGSCLSMVKVHYPTLEFDNHYKQLSLELSKKVFEFSEFFVNILQVTEFGSTFKGKVTYHDACHLLRELKIKDEPRKLMQNVKGLELIESENNDKCCGFGGTFSVKFSGLSDSMGEDKADGIIKTGADYVVANDNSCLMQIQDALIKKNSRIKPIHLAELLAEGI